MYDFIKKNNAARKQYTGSNIVVQGSKNGFLRQVKIYGKSIQNSAPTPENPVAIQNVPSSFDITSCGINLWDSKAMWDYVEAEVSSSNFERGVYDGRNCVRVRSLAGFNFYYGFKANTQYRFRYEHYDESDAPRRGVLFTIRYTDGTNGYMGAPSYRQWATTDNISAAGKSIDYLMMEYANSEWTRFNLDSFQITEGADDVDYIAYQGATKVIEIKDANNNLHELCSLPNGKRDEIDGNNIIKRIKTLTVTNSNGVTHAPVTETTSRVIFWDWSNRWGRVSSSANGLCNIALPHENFDIAYRFSVTKGDTYTALSLVLPKTELTTLDNSGVQAWVDAQIAANGPIIFQYEYAAEAFYKVNEQAALTLNTISQFETTKNYVYSNSDAAPELSISAISY